MKNPLENKDLLADNQVSFKPREQNGDNMQSNIIFEVDGVRLVPLRLAGWPGTRWRALWKLRELGQLSTRKIMGVTCITEAELARVKAARPPQ